jgi:hypothetical protein
VGIHALAQELTTQAFYPCRVAPTCPPFSFLITNPHKRIAGYGNPNEINQWLVQDYQGLSYTPSMQDAIINNAYSIANANKPAGRFVYRVTFFFDMIVPTGNVAYFIGADIQYAYCLNLILPFVRVPPAA